MVYLTIDDLIRHNENVTSRYGGLAGVRDRAALESCVAHPKTAVFDEERFKQAHEKAAALCFFVVKLHPFHDGNKRTAFVAALHFLLENSYLPKFDEQEMYEAIMSVAESKTDLEELFPVFEKAITA